MVVATMVLFRRMRTLVVPPLLGFSILLLWSSLSISDPILGRLPSRAATPLWSRRALNLERESVSLLSREEKDSGVSDSNSDVLKVIEPGKDLILEEETSPAPTTSNEEGESSKGSSTEREVAMEEVEKLVHLLRSQAVGSESKPRNKASSVCKGRSVFVYELPPKFNKDLLNSCETLLPWMSMCEFVSNSGMGSPVGEKTLLVPAGSWFKTHQYSLEMIFHSKILHYPCRVSQPELADVLYVPYYAGLDVLRWNFMDNVRDELRDSLPHQLMTWLDQQPAWRNSTRHDHVIVLGKITWDFRRMTSAPNGHWGSDLLQLPQMENVTRLLIERHPWEANDVGVPHPTFFHPSSDADVETWQARVLSVQVRPSLVSFAGQPRPGQAESIRGELIRQCLANSGECRVLDCGQGACFGPEATLRLFLGSDFCLQPAGDSPTRRSVFDSLLAGCIPVLFDPFTAYYQYPWHLPADREAYSVFIPGESVRSGGVDVVEVLRRIPVERRQQMRHYIVEKILPGIIYSQPGSSLTRFDDAFDISLRNLIARAASMKR